MNKERIIEIGKFLETRLFVHRQVEHNDEWTTEEKMIKDLYDSHLELKQENTNLKQALIDIREYINTRDTFVLNGEVMQLKDEITGQDILQIIDKVGGNE